jgi:hypothetical protein
VTSPQPRAVGEAEVEEPSRSTITEELTVGIVWRKKGSTWWRKKGLCHALGGPKSKILAREDSTSCCPKPLQEITVIMSFNSI